MKNRNLILMLIEKSTNAFGQVFGITEMTKLKTALGIIQSTIYDSFQINSVDLSQKKLSGILGKGILDMDQCRLLTNLLWAQAEVFLKLKQPDNSLQHYEYALQLLHWKAEQPSENGRLERVNKIIELESIIAELRQSSKINSAV
jgi:hypothetical protein